MLSRSASRLRVLISSAPLRHACLILTRMDQTQPLSCQKRRGKAVTTQCQPSTAHKGTGNSRPLPYQLRRRHCQSCATDMPHLLHSLSPSFNKDDHHRRPQLPASKLPASSAIHLIHPFLTSRTRTPHLGVPLLTPPTTTRIFCHKEHNAEHSYPKNFTPLSNEVTHDPEAVRPLLTTSLRLRCIVTASSRIAHRPRARSVGLACQSWSLGWSPSPRRFDRPSQYTVAMQCPRHLYWEKEIEHLTWVRISDFCSLRALGALRVNGITSHGSLFSGCQYRSAYSFDQVLRAA